jgi:hypothetical protein
MLTVTLPVIWGVADMSVSFVRYLTILLQSDFFRMLVFRRVHTAKFS